MQLHKRHEHFKHSVPRRVSVVAQKAASQLGHRTGAGLALASETAKCSLITILYQRSPTVGDVSRANFPCAKARRCTGSHRLMHSRRPAENILAKW